MPNKLRALHAEGYHIVIITNQGRLTDSKGGEAADAQPFKIKMETILKEIDIPLAVYTACANDNYRKPRIGTWQLLQLQFAEKCLVVDTENSYLVGDAAGRITDHSDADRHFSLNTGIDFFTPEVFFLEQAPLPLGHKFDPCAYLNLLPSEYHCPFLSTVTDRLLSLPQNPNKVLLSN